MLRTSFVSRQGSLRCTYASAFRLLQRNQSCICIAFAADKRFLHNYNIYDGSNSENSYYFDNSLWRQSSGSAVHPLVFTQQRGLHTSAHQHKGNKINKNNKKNKMVKAGKLKNERNSLSAIKKGKNSNKKITHKKKGKSTSALKSTVGKRTHKNGKHYSASKILGSKKVSQTKRNKQSKKSASYHKKSQSHKKQVSSQLPSTSHSTKHANKATSTHHRRQHSQHHKGKNNKHHVNKKVHQHNLLASSFASQRKHHHTGRPKQSAARRFVKKVAKSFKHAIGKD